MKNNLEHVVFRISLILKLFYSLFESLLGIFLFFINSHALYESLRFIFRHELSEDPSDLIVNFILNFTGGSFPSLKLFFSIYLIIHGIIKIALIIAILKEKLWVYPIAGTIFLIFTVYQLYKFYFSHSIFLLLLSIVDIIVILLLIPEYNHIRKVKRKNYYK